MSEAHAPMPIYVTGVLKSILSTAVQTEPQLARGVESHIMDPIVPQTSPTQNQAQREEHGVYTSERNYQSLSVSNGFYKYVHDLYDKHNSQVYPTP